MHLLLFRLKTIGWDELPEGVLVCRHLPPTASPKRTPSWKTPPCSCVRLERLSRAPGEGSLLHKPLGCVPFRNNVFELAAGQRQVLQGRTFFEAPLWSQQQRFPPSVSFLSHRFFTASLRRFRSLFPLAHLCFSAPVPPLLIAPYLPFSVLVSPCHLFFFTCVRLGNLRDFLKFPASCVKALNPQKEQIKSKTLFALPNAALLPVINLYFLLFPLLVIIGWQTNIK